MWIQTASKISVIEQLASKHPALVVLLQETHYHNAKKLVLPGFALAGAAHAVSDICDFKIINVYKLPPSQMTPTSVSMFSHSCLYAGDFNSQHTNWGYTNTNEDGSCLATWAAEWQLIPTVRSQGTSKFSLRRWGSETNPNLAFASSSDDDQLPADVSLRSSLSPDINRHS